MWTDYLNSTTDGKLQFVRIGAGEDGDDHAVLATVSDLRTQDGCSFAEALRTARLVNVTV